MVASLIEKAVKAAVKPRRRMSPWQWAEQHVFLGIRTTNSPGRYDSSWVPYVREWHDAFVDPRVKEISICANAQSGKSETLMNMVRYAVANDPGPMFWVTFAETFARSFSETRLQPSLKDCKPCAEQILDHRDKFKLLEMHLRDMTINLAGANSPGQLSSRPVRYLFLDEADKFPDSSSKEAAAVDLAKLRTTTFWNRKIVVASTPTVEGGPIWQAWLEGDMRRYFCPCPHCGAFQYLDFQQLKWPKIKSGAKWDTAKVEAETYYECKECSEAIGQEHKVAMVKAGEWRATKKGAPADKVSFHINALASPWRTWGSIAREFLESKERLGALQNFVNSIICEPWTHEAEEIDADQVARKKGGYVLGDRNKEVRQVTIAADVGRDYIAATARGWASNGESWLIDYAMLDDFGELRDWGAEFDPVMGLVDSGFRTQEVYEFCSKSGRLYHPSKGWDARPQLVKASPITFYEGANYREIRINLFHFNAGSFKADLYLRRIQDNEGHKWHLPSDVGNDFLSQLCAEQLVPKKNARGVVTQQWVQVKKDNHYGDCEVMQLVMWHMLANKLARPVRLEQSDEVKQARAAQQRRKKITRPKFRR